MCCGFLQIGDAYKATGRCFSVAAGRISFSYGLKGWIETVATTSERSTARLCEFYIHPYSPLMIRPKLQAQRLLWTQPAAAA